MLPALLTPLMLAVAPIQIDVGTLTYDHVSQQSSEGSSASTMATSTPTSTYNGTQTFDYQGHPKDSDQDTDADPFNW